MNPKQEAHAQQMRLRNISSIADRVQRAMSRGDAGKAQMLIGGLFMKGKINDALKLVRGLVMTADVLATNTTRDAAGISSAHEERSCA